MATGLLHVGRNSWTESNAIYNLAGAAHGHRAGDVPHVARQVGGQPPQHAQPQAARRRRRPRARGLRRRARLPRAEPLAQRRARLLAQVLAPHSTTPERTREQYNIESHSSCFIIRSGERNER